MADETTEKAEKPIDTSVKARYWWAVLYQENMVDGWRDNIEELLQLPYAYCEHVADVDGKGEHRKDHVHVIIGFCAISTTAGLSFSWSMWRTGARSTSAGKKKKAPASLTAAGAFETRRL